MKGFISLILFLIATLILSSQSCLPDGIYIYNQAQIDSFQIDYPGCTEIEGKLWIGGSDIVNLEGLSVLTAIGGNLILEETNLINLTGFESLNSIGGDLYIGSWENGGSVHLKNIEALSNLSSVLGAILIFNNESLTSLQGLSGLSSVLQILILDNDSLISLSGLENLESIENYLVIGGNNSLMSLSKLENIEFVGGLGIGSFNWGGNNLSNLIGLEGLNYIPGDVSISYNHLDLNSLIGLHNLDSIGGKLWVYRNYNLVDFVGLEDLKKISGNLDIYKNYNLESFNGLGGLVSVGDYVSVSENDKIKNFEGLEQLSRIDSYLRIKSNLILNSLMGLDNINPLTITDLTIKDNPSLSTCDIKSICGYLISPNGVVDIDSNWAECEDRAAVEASCEDFSVDESNLTKLMRIYPNPANNKLNIFAEGLTIDELVIYTLTGQQILFTRPKNGTIDISHLQPGMYILEVTIENTRIRQKLLVQR